MRYRLKVLVNFDSNIRVTLTKKELSIICCFLTSVEIELELVLAYVYAMSRPAFIDLHAMNRPDFIDMLQREINRVLHNVQDSIMVFD